MAAVLDSRRPMNRTRRFAITVVAPFLFLSAIAFTQDKDAQLPSETPAVAHPTEFGFDYTRREVMIPMRDGVKLHTVILVPKGAKDAGILLTRTPYNAKDLTSHTPSAHLAPSLQGYDNATDVIVEGGYIRVVQDIRGKYGSEGDYVMTRPFKGPLNPTAVDESTDTYDTIDWLVKNLPESNGRVGIIGISYDGYLSLTALVHPHPALKVAVPMNPMVDGWMGDDWFHNGAFRETNESYVWEQEATRDNDLKWWRSHFDDYDEWLAAVSAGEMGRQHGLEQTGFWRKIVDHPAYDAWWQQQAMDKILAQQPLTVPTMLVHSLWDQEDIYGAPAVWRALKDKADAKQNLYLVLGPWHHGQAISDGATLGNLNFRQDTSYWWRLNVLRPFLARYLKGDTSQPEIARVTAFETGTNRWLRLPTWPAGCESGCTPKGTPLYLHAGGKADFSAPRSTEAKYDEYVSDPAKPVPFVPRPVSPYGYGTENTWPIWLVMDQRGPASRPDVVSFVSDVLDKPMKISGRPMVNLVASTSGTDSDWVVKVIDLYPDEMGFEPDDTKPGATDARMGGYQLMISADIFRGRYRESFETPHAIAPNQPLTYKFALPNADHVFLPGHRIMVQVQSTWYPLYDRNPQTFVQNIFWAKPADYQKATQRIFHTTSDASFIELPLVEQRSSQ